MAITNTAAFAQAGKTGTASVTGMASTSTNTPSNTVKLTTAGGDGALVTSVSAMPRSTVTASGLYLFISKDSGSTKELVSSILMAAHTVAATTAIPISAFTSIGETTPLRLEAGDELYVGSGVSLANGIVFTAEWTDF